MRKVLIALGLVAALGAAGCASNADAKAEKKAVKPTSTTTTTQPFVLNTKNTPGTLKHFVGAHEDVHDTTCHQDGAWWNATGKVTNPTKRAARYRIYVSFLNGDTTVGLAQVDVGTVGPKNTQVWHEGVKVAGKDLRCILRVERADA